MRGIRLLATGLLAMTGVAAAHASGTETTSSVPRQLELSPEDRYALLTGLRTRVGGRFVISGLRDAEATCVATNACITVSQLQQRISGNEGLQTARGPLAILNAINVDGRPAVTIVSLRAAGYDAHGQLQILTSVLNARTGQWMGKTATLGYPAPYPLDTANVARILRVWQDSSW